MREGGEGREKGGVREVRRERGSGWGERESRGERERDNAVQLQ